MSHRALTHCIFLFILFLVHSNVDVYAQNKAIDKGLQIEAPWCRGTVLLIDKEELTGNIRFNEKIGLLSFENGDDIRSLTARTVAGFEMFDSTLRKNRVFYTFEYLDPATQRKMPLFFEMLREFETFSILSKVDPINLEEKSRKIPSGSVNGQTPVMVGYAYQQLEQTETIYLMDLDGKIEPYVKTLNIKSYEFNKEKEREKAKFVDRDLLKDFVGATFYDSIKAFSKRNDLSIKRKPDLIRILDYYSQLVKNK